MAKNTKRPAGSGKAARRSAAQWAVEVAAWKRSGDTSREYARTRGISAATLLWWSSRGGLPVSGRTQAVTPVVTDRAAPRGSRRAFLEVQVVAPADTGPRLEAEVVLAGGRRVRVVGALTLGQFAQVLRVVEGGSVC